MHGKGSFNDLDLCRLISNVRYLILIDNLLNGKNNKAHKAGHSMMLEKKDSKISNIDKSISISKFYDFYEND